jgi:hypothetical protein
MDVHDPQGFGLRVLEFLIGVGAAIAGACWTVFLFSSKKFDQLWKRVAEIDRDVTSLKVAAGVQHQMHNENKARFERLEQQLGRLDAKQDRILDEIRDINRGGPHE